MARCPNCPALKEFPNIGVIEYYAFGNGCLDEDFDIYGGDCYFANFGDEEVFYDEELDKFDLYYDREEMRIRELEEVDERCTTTECATDGL